MKVYLGADHAGFKLKEKIKKELSKLNIEFEDLGVESERKVDYPKYAFAVGKKVASDRDSRGILICGTGTGMCIAANKVKGVRAAFAYDLYSAKMSREDNDANVLCLRGRKFSEKEALKIVRVWLDEKFSGLEKHKRRLDEISKYEKRG